MLILTRRPGERVMIGDDISITILGVRGNEARVGVEAPRDVGVHREEVYARLVHEREQGARQSEAEPESNVACAE